jgi:hypothetical protein
MAVPKALWDKVESQAQDWTPPPKPRAADAPEPQKGYTVGEALSEFGGDVTSFAKRGLQGVDQMEKAAITAILGSGKLIPETGVAGDIARKIMRPVFDDQTKDIQARTKDPKTVGGKVLGPAAEGAAATLALPIPGGISRNIVAGMGMGELANIGKNVFGGLFEYFGGPSARPSGEATGEILGGGIGAQANVTRMKAMGEMVRQPIEALKSIKPAYESAKAAQAAGDQRKMWEIFADEFGNLRANTRGIVQDFVNRSLASTIRKDIRASQMAEDFTKDAATTGMDVKPWGLGERTMVPALTETIAAARPGSYAEASEIAGRATAMKSSIREAYGKLVSGSKIPATPEGITGAAKVFQGITQAKVDALTKEANNIKEAFPRFDATQEFQVGEQARAIRDRLRNEAFQRGQQRYTMAEDMWNAEGATVDPGNVRTEAKEILAEFYSKVKPEEVPPVVRNLLSATGKGEKAAESGLILPDDIAAEKAAAAAAEEAAGKPLALKEANDLYKALGEAGANATMAEKHTAANRAKQLQAQLVDSITGAKASPEAKKAWQDAVEMWRRDYAERFQEGLGKALGKERGGIYAGREAIKSEKVMDEALSGATALAEFDKVFGSEPQAQRLLADGLQNRFRKEVLDRSYTQEGFERTLDAFKRKYAPGLERFPGVAEKVDRESANFAAKQAEKSAELQRYKDIMGSDVTAAVGPIQAKQMFQAALADPLKMQRLLTAYKGAPQSLVEEVWKQANPFRNGEYDADAILNMVRAGKRTGDTPSSMELLFTKAFGEKEGERHLATLEAISNFTKRQAATDPRYLQAGSLLSDRPVKEATGQSMASWISAWRAQASGQTGASYFTTLGLSRFANVKVQQAIERAKHRALYDPKTADAILELVATDKSQPISLTTARKIFGDIRLADGKRLVDRLIDKGYVKQYISRGIIYGTEKALQEKEDATQ